MNEATLWRRRRRTRPTRPLRTRLHVERLEDRLVPSTTWVEQGPGPILGGFTEGIPGNTVAGAIEAIAVNPTNANIVYAGSVNGGVWKTTNATAANPTWTPLTDLQLPEISIDSLALSPLNPNTVFAGTGSTSSFFAYGSPGIGLARSTDGGTTWTILAQDTFAGQRIRRVVPTTLSKGKVILVATEFAGDIPVTAAKGLYRSTDNGASFVRISGGADTGLPDQEVSDLVADPSNPSRFYAAVPVPNRSAPTGHEGIYKSEDGGLTWAVVNTGLPALNSTYRIFLSVHNSPGSDVIYSMLISNSPLQLQGVFRSADQGASWVSMGVPNMNFFPNGNDLTGAILADRYDPNVVYISGDSGSGNAVSILVRGDFSRQNPWSTLFANDCNGTAPHGDSRAMVFDANGNTFFAGTADTSFPSATTFMGDYSCIAVTPTGQVAALWTDMRLPSPLPGFPGSGEDAFFALVDPPAALTAASAVTKNASTQMLSYAAVQPVLTQALARWAAAGVNPSALAGIDIHIADLAGATLGIASGNTIYLDATAAGWGWFIDPTPADDSEFTTPGNQGEMNHMDLLTVLEHELGHILGYQHTATGLMNDTLAAGIREMPTAVIDQFFAGF